MTLVSININNYGRFMTFLQLNGSRNITHASCQCPAGVGSKCKHVAALIIFINNEEGVSKTNEPQIWGKPSKYGVNVYKKGKQISDLFPQKRLRLDVPPVSLKDLIKNHNILQLPCSLTRNLHEENRSETVRLCSNILNNIISTIETDFRNEQNNKHLISIIKKQIQLDILYYYAFPLNGHEHNFFYKNIIVNTETIKLIFSQTLDQSKNVVWSEYRKLRISASMKAHKIKTLKSITQENQNKLALSFLHETVVKGKGASNMLYGLETENKAFNTFSLLYNVEVIKSELIIHISKPWICASPDGLILNNGEINSVLEIKCPTSCKNKPIIDSITGMKNLSYLKLQNNEIVLKPSHVYYTKIQILLYCTGLNDYKER